MLSFAKVLQRKIQPFPVGVGSVGLSLLTLTFDMFTRCVFCLHTSDSTVPKPLAQFCTLQKTEKNIKSVPPVPLDRFHRVGIPGMENHL